MHNTNQPFFRSEFRSFADLVGVYLLLPASVSTGYLASSTWLALAVRSASSEHIQYGLPCFLHVADTVNNKKKIEICIVCSRKRRKKKKKTDANASAKTSWLALWLACFAFAVVHLYCSNDWLADKSKWTFCFNP